MPTISCIRAFFRAFAIHFIHNDILLLSHYRAPARALRSTEETNTKNKFKTKLHTQKKQGSLSPAGLTDPAVLPLAKKKTKTAWIHLHGMNDFSTSERFLDSLRNVALENNFAFFSFGNRGMGHISVFRKFEKKTVNYVTLGTSMEKFEHCIYDIDGAINALRKEGYKKFVLSGHSTGCNKILYYYSKTKNPSVRALVLLSPV